MTLTYGFSDEKAFTKMQEKETEWFEMFAETGPAATLNMWPALRFIVPSVRKVYKEFDTITKDYVNAYKAFTNKRKSEFDGKNPQICIDHFLSMMDKPVKLGELNQNYSEPLLRLLSRIEKLPAKQGNVRGVWVTRGGLDGDNNTQKRCEKHHQGPYCHTGSLTSPRDFSRITRPKGGILKVACPAQTRPNGQIPVQNGGMAGL